MVDIQFPTAENRRGKKERKKEDAKYNGLPMGGHNKCEAYQFYLYRTGEPAHGARHTLAG